MQKRKQIFWGVILALSVVSCGGYSVTGGPGKTVNPSLVSRVERNAELVHVNSVLVLPLAFDAQVIKSEAVQKELNDSYRRSIEQDLTMEVLFASDLSPQLKSGSLPTPQQVEGASVDALSLKNMALKKSVDGILRTQVHEFVERQGSRIGTAQGAQVHFTVRLTRPDNGAELWGAQYTFRDQSLSENLFRMKQLGEERTYRGLGWRSARELLATGLTKAWGDLMARRTQEFVRDRETSGGR